MLADKAKAVQDVSLTAKVRLRYYAVCSPAAALIGLLCYDSLFVACAFALCPVFAEKRYARHLREVRKHRLTYEFRDLLLSLSSSFATGRHMKEALLDAEYYLKGSLPSDSPMLDELALLVRRLTLGGESERIALQDLATRSSSEDIRSFVDVYYTCLETGGDLVKAVGRSAETLIDKIGIEKEIETLTAQRRYESLILSITPAVIIAFLRVSSPAYVAPLYKTAAGAVVMTLALGAIALAALWSRRILRTEI